MPQCDVNRLWALSTVYTRLTGTARGNQTMGMPRHAKAGRFRGTSPLAELVDFVFFHLFWAFEAGGCLPLRPLEAVAFASSEERCWTWRHHTRAELRAIAAVGRGLFARAVLSVVGADIRAHRDDDWAEAERVTAEALATERFVSTAQEDLMRERLRAIRHVRRAIRH